MQIILSVAKWIKSSRVFSKLPSCRWRTNDHWQPEAPLGKWTEPKVCLHPKKAKLESLVGTGQGKGLNSLQRESALVLGTQRKESFSHFPALPQVWDPMKFWFQKAKVHIPALLLWGDPFPIEKTIKPNPCLRTKWKQSTSGPGGNSHSQVTQRLSEALNPS